MDSQSGTVEVLADSSLCPSCGGGAVRSFYRVRDVPVSSGVLLESRLEALAIPRGDVDLCFCTGCGFVFNRSFDPELVEYSERYEQAQSFSQTFSAFNLLLAEQLIERHNLRKRSIIEIGCGNGEFLMLLCELGNNDGTGFDPAYVAQRSRAAENRRVKFVNDFFSERYANHYTDFICCRMTLEHISSVEEFLTMIRRATVQGRDTAAFFQVPDFSLILKEKGFWDIYYEHCSYFTAGSLSNLFMRAGYSVQSVWTDYGAQYLMIEAVPATKLAPSSDRKLDLDDLEANIGEFANSVPDVIRRWQREIRGLAANDRKTVLWGSGSKAVSFLTTLGIADELRYVVDINPYRQGMFMPGTGHEIVGPEQLAQYRPDVVIVMNPIYLDEISATLRSMSLKPDIRTMGVK